MKGNQIMGFRNVITALDNNGRDVLGTGRIAYRLHDQSIVSGSLLTVESNHFAVLKSRGAVLKVYDTGQFQLETPDKPLLGNIQQGFFGGNSPWQFEVIYVNRAKLLVQNKGIATTSEMAMVEYTVDYYIHVDTEQGALDLTTHLPFNGAVIDTTEVAAYAGPAIEQAINQIIQVTPLENINEKIDELRDEVKVHLGDFLKVYGIHLNDLKILVLPQDPQIREAIALRALGVPADQLGQYYLALRMAEKGLITAPNAAAGVGVNIGGTPLLEVPNLLGKDQG